MQQHTRSIPALILGSLLGASLLAGPARAADNPFAVAQAPAAPELQQRVTAEQQERLQERAREAAGAAKKCTGEKPAEKCQAGKCQSGKAAPETPAAASGALQRDKLKSGFCGAGKCGGGKCGESLKQQAPQ